MENGDEIQYDDVINEYVQRKGLVGTEGIRDDIHDRWHNYATTDAEDEIKRLCELAIVCILNVSTCVSHHTANQ